MSRAEIIFDHPNPKVTIIFPFHWPEDDPTSKVMISNLPFPFARELARRWNYLADHDGETT
jgi:hypothetical protein